MLPHTQDGGRVLQQPGYCQGSWPAQAQQLSVAVEREGTTTLQTLISLLLREPNLHQAAVLQSRHEHHSMSPPIRFAFVFSVFQVLLARPRFTHADFPERHACTYVLRGHANLCVASLLPGIFPW